MARVLSFEHINDAVISHRHGQVVTLTLCLFEHGAVPVVNAVKGTEGENSGHNRIYFFGLIVGKKTVSRPGLFMSTEKSRSEKPKPAIGGIPYSIAST